MPKGIPLTEEEHARRRREIFDATIHLILEKGFTETSMREIATEAGVGKSTLYDYFHTKEDLLVFVVEEQLNHINHIALDIASQDGSAVERLRQLMQIHLDYLVKNKNFLLQLMLEIQRLSPASQKKIQLKRYAYQDLLRSLIEQGVAQGSIRQVDPAMVAKILIALMTPVVFTSRPVGSPEQMLSHALDIVMNGIQA